MTTIQCGGINVQALAHPIIEPDDYAQFDAAINQARKDFLALNAQRFSGRYATGDLTAGVRFLSNREVLVRIVSACPSREDFDAHQGEWIAAGLKECASADYWYTFEKDWGHEKDDDGE